MRAIPVWIDKIQDKDRIEQCIHDIVYKPDGSQLIVAAGSRVLVYNAEDGTLIQPLKAHKDLVYCLAYSKDGQRFASGSKDKHVIIWTSKLEGILKYSHNDAIQYLSYNPTSALLASCAVSDFGLWSPEQKSVQKYKVGSRITCCSWSPDGQLLALALYSGHVTVRNKSGEEKLRLERPGGLPVWALSFNPSKEEPANVLCVADWSRTLSFYQMNGKQVYKDRTIDFDPLCVTYFSKGEFILLSGSNRQALLYTREGIKLGAIGEEQESWVWCCKPKPDSNHVVLGCQDGSLVCYQLVFSTVHGLYKERYAYRDNMTDVIIQHLLTEQRGEFFLNKMRERNLLHSLVQLPERIIIYELLSGETNGMHYHVKEKINQSIQCNLLVVCTNNIVLCQERKLQCLTFQGVKEREWILEGLIRYIKVIGGDGGREGLLLGLKNGQIHKIFLDNPFPISLIKINTAVRCLDLSSSRTKLAVVDDQNTCLVYDLTNKELLFQEPNANSVAWNSYYEHMLCFSGNGLLSIKVADFAVHQQKLQGFVVGFCGSKVFCLHVYAMAAVEIPQSAPMFQYLEKNLFREAYAVACLGVTDSDWEALAHSALEGQDFEISRKAFIRLKDLKYLELIRNLESRKKTGNAAVENKDGFSADIFAYRGLFAEAAKLYKKNKQSAKALEMYTDLRMFDKAQKFVSKSAASDGSGRKAREGDSDDGEQNVGGIDEKSLLRKKADWAANSNEPRIAVEMYLSVGENDKAIEIAGKNCWIDMLVDIARQVDKADRASLTLCAEYLKNLNQLAYAVDVYQKMGDTVALAKLRIQTKQWEEAFLLAEKFPELREMIYLPYAQELAENDKFLEAQEAFRKAGQQQVAYNTLQELTHNAVHESRFDDAGYYYWILSRHCLEPLPDAQQGKDLLEIHKKYSKYSNIYYAYHTIQRFIDEPFTSYMPEAIFNIARFLFHEILKDCPPGVSRVSILYALAKQGKTLGAYKLARFAYDRLQQLQIPSRFQELIDLGTLSLRSKPFHDAEELLILCYRCSTTNPILNQRGNQCVNCCQPFVHSFVSFEILPLVQFFLEEGISDADAKRLIETEGKGSTTSDPRSNENQWSEVQTQGYEALTFDGDPENIIGETDPFTSRLMSFEQGGSEYSPVIVNRRVLTAMDPVDIIILKRPPPLNCLYYRNLMQDVPIAICPSCNKMFHLDDYELQLLQQDRCSFCRVSAKLLKSDKFENFPATT